MSYVGVYRLYSLLYLYDFAEVKQSQHDSWVCSYEAANIGIIVQQWQNSIKRYLKSGHGRRMFANTIWMAVRHCNIETILWLSFTTVIQNDIGV